MDEAKIPPGLQRFYVQTTQNPQSRFARRAFLRYLEPAQRARVDDMLKRHEQSEN